MPILKPFQYGQIQQALDGPICRVSPAMLPATATVCRVGKLQIRYQAVLAGFQFCVVA